MLAACQLVPTWELAKRAEARRTNEYLSGFAQSPVHLVSYVVPGLFHRSPLWRPIAWDPFHTSPEECFGYVGLIPLWLALSVVFRESRRDAGVRVLIMLGAVTLLLSLGPLVPGFWHLTRLPGFSFFRAPARWGSATMLALSLLAAIGFDRVTTWRKPRASLTRFIVASALLAALVAGVVELAFASTEKPGMPAVADAFERARQWMPWKNDPTFAAVMAQARRPNSNPIVQVSLRRKGLDPGSRLDRERWSIYREEIGPTAALLLAAVCLTIIARTPRALSFGLILLSACDLILLARQRDVDTGPIKSLVEQSPVLQALAKEARATRGRVVDPLGNLSMLAGASPVVAYRTLDVPVLQGLVRVAQTFQIDRRREDQVAYRMDAIGATVRVIEPGGFDERELPSLRWFSSKSIEDAALAAWLLGRQRLPVDEDRATVFHMLTLQKPTGRAWMWPGGVDWTFSTLADRELPTPFVYSDPSPEPLAWQSHRPEEFIVSPIKGSATARGRPRDRMSPTDGTWRTIIISQLYDPEWRGVWSSVKGEKPAELFPVFGQDKRSGWIASEVPGPGIWTLRLVYEGRAARFGLVVSIAAWLVWLTLWFRPWKLLQRASPSTASPLT